MSDFLTLLTDTLAEGVVTASDDVPARYHHDWAGLPAVRPLALVRPRTTQEVSDTLRLCHENGVPVVPQGGLTGISGAAHPEAAGIVLSLERMNAIRAVNPRDATMSAEAGVILEAAQGAAADADLMLAIDIGARGSCQLGGVIATNAGGHNVVRYGMTRDQVLGLEVVLADGTILEDMNTLVKNNAGLDLKQLFIGSEGLLGVITACVLRLHPASPARETALVGCASTDDAIEVLNKARTGLGSMLTAFEVMWASFHDTMASRCDVPTPLSGKHAVYIIVEARGPQGDSTRQALEGFLETAFESGLIEDAVLANSVREEHAIWAVRETPAEYATVLGPVIPFDIGIPTDRMAETVAKVEARIQQGWPDALALFYGHIGDNNLHLVVHVPAAGDTQPEAEVKAAVYAIVRDMGGTISAEHGIGAIKRDYMHYSRTQTHLRLMQSVKTALDPKGIMNPGKGFDQLAS